MSGTFWAERAWLGEGPVLDQVEMQVAGGRFTSVRTGVAQPASDAERLAGLTIPGLANCHSHAFHRALRGRTQRAEGTFWTWRQQMYAAAARLDPDLYFELALATYREMAATGITSVGEFHYLHHDPDGAPYQDPNTMSHALIAAAKQAGIRIALLDTCYLASQIGSPPEGVQLRYSDGNVEAWRDRVDALVATAGDEPDVVVGAAIHSIRAVPRAQVTGVVGWVAERQVPLHLHLSEQVEENEASLAAYGATPTAVFAEEGALGPRTSAVHATHLAPTDIRMLGAEAGYVTICPTTERDLGDGIGPTRELSSAGARLTLGTDSHAVVDLFEEMRGVEMDQRLASRRRGHWTAEQLLVAATRTGHESLGFPDGGRITAGGRADLVTLDTASIRTAGTGAGVEGAVFAATAADVSSVVSGGRLVSTGADRPDIARSLERVIARVWEER